MGSRRRVGSASCTGSIDHAASCGPIALAPPPPYRRARINRETTMAKFGIGQAVRRVEDQRFITGAGRYVDDIVLPGMCHGVNLLSPHAHARIKKIDTVEGQGRARRRAGADRRGRRGRSSRRLHGRADAGGRRRAEGPSHLPAGAAGRDGALRRRPRGVRGGRDAGAGARRRRHDRGRLRAAARGRADRRCREGRRAEGVGRQSERQRRLHADVRQQGGDRRGVRQGEARREARDGEQPAHAGVDGAAHRDRRLQRGGRPLHALYLVAESARRALRDRAHLPCGREPGARGRARRRRRLRAEGRRVPGRRAGAVGLAQAAPPGEVGRVALGKHDDRPHRPRSRALGRARARRERQDSRRCASSRCSRSAPISSGPAW